MEKDSEITRLARKLRRDLKARFIVWPTLSIFFAGIATLNFYRMKGNMEVIADWDLSADASPEMIRLAVIQGVFPIIASFFTIAIPILAIAYCIVRLIQPRTEAHLLLALMDRRQTDGGSQQIDDGNAGKPPGVEPTP